MTYHIFADRSKIDRNREVDTVTVTSEKLLKILQKQVNNSGELKMKSQNSDTN